MLERLTCTKIVRREIPGKTPQGKQEYRHVACGEPAAEYVIGGLLTTAKAVLCERHKRMADRQNFVSKNGYTFGNIGRKEKAKNYQQERLPGTGVV